MQKQASIEQGLNLVPQTLAGGVIFDIKKYALHDGPGIRTTVYLKGCPLSCAWCHNPEGQASKPTMVFWPQRCIQCQCCLQVCPGGHAQLNSEACTHCGRCVEACPAGARETIGQWMTVDQILAEIKKDVIFYDESGGGVTFSGGEPLAHPDFLQALLQGCKEMEIHTAVDTTGFTSHQTLARLAPLADIFLYDLKLMDDDAHRRFTGVSNRPILENLRWLNQSGKAVVVRVPIIPGITGSEQNIDEIGRFVGALDTVKQVDILAYHPMAADKYDRLGMHYSLPDIQAPSSEKMAQIAGRLQSYGLLVNIGG